MHRAAADKATNKRLRCDQGLRCHLALQFERFQQNVLAQRAGELDLSIEEVA